jgi:acyl-coenzyme A thioesterase PaaI-like protein
MRDASIAKERFTRLSTNRLKFSLFLLRYLPAAFFSGVRIIGLTDTECQVTVPYKWFSRNPFGSTYFACLAMAAELSTGTLALLHGKGAGRPVSMLVLDMKAEFHKKATASTRFTCAAGSLLEQAIRTAIEQQQPQTCTVSSTGVNSKGEAVATFHITWTFKMKSV